MAAHYRDDLLHGKDHQDTHASETRWRHQESSSFARHARPADERTEVTELAGFLNASRVKPPGSAGSGSAKSTPIIIPENVYNAADGSQILGTQHDGVAASGYSTTESLYVKCGPLLNYRRMENETWFGSVLIVTRGGGKGESLVVPELQLRVTGAVEISTGNGMEHTIGQSSDTNPSSNNGVQNGVSTGNGGGLDGTRVRGTKLYSDPSNTFWRFDLQVQMQQSEIQCEYFIPGLSFEGKKRDKQNFFVPAVTDSMRIMFHSCNGFSVGTDEEAWSGPALWNDVLRIHKKTPFHVMIGGGDQIYNDGVRVNGPLRKWTDIGNPLKRKDHPFPEDLRKECDHYYVNNYIRWYGTEPFASANVCIPQINIWDDHDIIDGFGSYVDDFMRCPVFRGIGGVANKYYLLFQHHLPPPQSTYTTDAPQTTDNNIVGIDQRQLENTYVLEEMTTDPSYIIGSKPGPYVVEHSRSIYARLGKHISFFGIDARTERTRHQVNYPETYEIIFNRLHSEMIKAKQASTPIRHLIVLLGIPIAYPRLTWLENIFTSPIIAPIKFLNKRFGFGGSFFNHFDGSVDLLDDMDDHYCSRNHKKERLDLVHQLQQLAAEFSIRITILGGDVHLAAVGRFYSNPKLSVPVQNDHRYMANIISSAIVNKPPPQAVANLLARRNKLHHLDHNTDETLMKFFDRDPGNAHKTSSSNHVTMPSRNWTMITENSSPSGHCHGQANDHSTETEPAEKLLEWKGAKDGHSWLHAGEVDAGTTHKAADMERHGKGTDGSLDVCIRVEIDQHDKEGKTQLYGMTIPLLDHQGAAEDTLRKRDAVQGAISERVHK